MSIKRAIARISLSALGDLLHLPTDCHIYSIQRAHKDHKNGTISLYLQGEGLPEADPGKPSPEVRLIYEKSNNQVKLKAIRETK